MTTHCSNTPQVYKAYTIKSTDDGGYSVSRGCVYTGDIFRTIKDARNYIDNKAGK